MGKWYQRQRQEPPSADAVTSPVFGKVSQLQPIAAETIARHERAVPSDLAAFWREHGAGLLGDGFVRVVDPDRAISMLGGVGFNTPAVPVFTTALADVIVYIEPAFHLIQFRFGVIDFLAFDSPKLFADLQEEAFLDLILSRQPYPAGVQRLGVPGLDECFGFVPLLALGGKEDAAYLDRGGLWEHIAVITQFAGPPAPRRH
jgi:hypothetical protein